MGQQEYLYFCHTVHLKVINQVTNLSRIHFGEIHSVAISADVAQKAGSYEDIRSVIRGQVQSHPKVSECLHSFTVLQALQFIAIQPAFLAGGTRIVCR